MMMDCCRQLIQDYSRSVSLYFCNNSLLLSNQTPASSPYDTVSGLLWKVYHAYPVTLAFVSSVE